ncbi:transcription termination/antitermination protein NusA [Candidatus Magnetomoraceae bacterium gMMP-1]
MLMTDIRRVIEQISRDKGINREVLIEALEEALRSAVRKKYGNGIDIEVSYNEPLGEIEVFQFKEVAEKITAPEKQISIEEGRKLDPDCEPGDSLGTKLDTTSFGRIAAQSAKQVIIQKMKDAERDAVYKSFTDRKEEIINGIVQRIERGNIIVNLGHTEGKLTVSEQVPRENFRRGDRIRAYIFDVLHDTRGPQILLSRTHPGFLIQLFKTEVPEISEGIVDIMGAVREPGSRAKIAVASSDSDIDPIGACVGMKGSRVQNVVQELRGEKIDIIPWHADSAKFVCNALAPAQISRVIIDEEHNYMEVIVPDEFLSIAIGKRGQNVRLASKLTGWHLDVKSESLYSETMRDGYDSLMQLPKITISIADALYEKGFFSVEELSNANVKDLLLIRELDEENAHKLIKAAQNIITGVSEDEVPDMDENSNDLKEATENSVSDLKSENREESDLKQSSEDNLKEATENSVSDLKSENREESDLEQSSENDLKKATENSVSDLENENREESDLEQSSEIDSNKR